MTDIDKRVWQSYHLDTVQPEHPLRLLIDELKATREERDRILQIARENGAERDRARREAGRDWVYATFDDYADEREVTGTRLERFYDDLEGASSTRMVKWLRAAFDAGRKVR